MCCSLEKGMLHRKIEDLRLSNTNEFSASSNVSQSIWCKHLEHLLLRDPTLWIAMSTDAVDKKEGAKKDQLAKGL